MKLRQSIYLSAALGLAALWLAGCAAGSSNNPPPAPPAIQVSLSPQPPSSLNISATTPVTAVVSNDTSNSGVRWTISCSSTSCGTLSATTTASGTAATYSAPATAPSPAAVTITATSISDTTKTVSAIIAISTPSQPIAVSLTPQPPATLTSNTTTSFAAAVSNDAANAGVTWKVTCGSSLCGTINPANTPSGTATTYTAPSAPPTPGTVTVTATSITDTTKSASASITILAPPAILKNGNYVYHLSGYDSTGPYFVAGAFTVQSGAITGGEQDFMDNDGSENDTLVPATSSISTANGNIQITLDTGDPNIGVNGVQILRGTIVSSNRVLISEFDASATGTGSLDFQTGTAAPSGGYAFNLGGLGAPNGDGQQSALVIGGILNVSGSSINIANSVLDYNNGGTVGQGKSFSAGSITAPDAFGRVTMTLTPALSSGLPAVSLAGYIVGTNQIQLVEVQNDPLNADLGGMALGQGNNTGNFTQQAVAGASYAFAAQGEDQINYLNLGGGFGLNADGTVSGHIAFNNLNLHNGSTITSGNYTVDATGRVTINVVATVTPVNGAPYTLAYTTFQLYLDGNGNALELGDDSSQATSGVAFRQTAPSSDYEGNYALQGQGFGNFASLPVWAAVGPVTIASDVMSGFTDYSIQDANNVTSLPIPAVALSGSENSATGLFTINGLNAQSNTSGFGYYPIDATRVLAIELDGNQLGLLILEGVQAN